MPVVEIDNSNISLSEIQICVDQLNAMADSIAIKEDLLIRAKKRVESIDPLLFTYLVLYKSRLPSVTVTLDLSFNSNRAGEGEDSEGNLIYEVMKYKYYGYLMTGKNVFNVNFQNDGKKEEADINLDIKRPDSKSWFSVSRAFFPIILITDIDKSFNYFYRDSLFSILEEKGIRLNELPAGVQWVEDDHKLRSYYYNYLKVRARLENPLDALTHLAAMYFIQALQEAKVLNLFFEKEYDILTYSSGKKIKAGYLENRDAYDYYLKVKPVFVELQHSSLIHHFFFGTIISSEMLRDKNSGRDILNKKSEEDFVLKIINLWEFTKDLAAGIKELAKNIREHSDPAIGAISMKISSINEWSNSKSTVNKEIYSRYREFLLKANPDESSSVIEINVVDIGKKGIIPTLISSTEKLATSIQDTNKEIKKLILEDIKSLKSKTIGFRNLFNSQNRQLNQQSKRSIAHFGILTLAKLISQNKGLVIASSVNEAVEGGRDSVCIIDENSIDVRAISLGTNYNLALPIQPGNAYTTHLPHKINMPTEITAREIKGLEELFSYQVVNSFDLNDSFEFKAGEKYIIEVCPSGNDLENRDDEDLLWLWVMKEIQRKDNLLLNKKNRKKSEPLLWIICLNLKDSILNESQFFRLMGKCELNFPGIPVIVTNIGNDYYLKFLGLNEEFHEQNNALEYWNENIAALVYSYIKVNEEQFNFCDVLFGKTKQDFIHLNWLVGFSSLNSTSILQKDFIREQLSKLANTIDANTPLLFNSKNVLLPFDLILTGNDNASLFEQNTIVLLKNELTP